MRLSDEGAEYAFSGTEFTNIGTEDNSLFDFCHLAIFFKGIYKSEDECGVNSIVIRLEVLNKRTTAMWLCSSLLLNNAEDFQDDYLQIEPEKEQEIDIWVESIDIAYSNNRRARLHLILEDGRRRLLGRCNSICVDYNIFSGKYQYKIIEQNCRGQRRENREIDLRVNKMNLRDFYPKYKDYYYTYKTIPIIITNCTNRNRAFLIERIEFDSEVPEHIIGINALTDAISIGARESYELSIVLPISDDYEPDEGFLFFDFIDIATNNRYINAYTYDYESKMCIIDYSFVFFHDSFE